MTGIKVEHNRSENRFEVNLQGQKAVLIYSIKSELFIFINTEVPPAHEGKGIASKMAKEALNFARENGYKVRSYCSFATRYIAKHEEYKDLLG
jgi:predicted GNAT family acetyltransferase